MEIVALPKSVILECKQCGCKISVKHDNWVNVIKGKAVQRCPCCKESDFIKISYTY